MRTRGTMKHSLSQIILIFIATCELSRFGPLIIKSVVKTAGRLLRPSSRPSYWSLLAGHVNIDFYQKIFWSVGSETENILELKMMKTKLI